MNTNPFIVSRPVPPERFIGNEREVEAILDRLANPAPSNTAVSGEVRIGKTSLLHYISSPKVAEKWGLSPEKCMFIFLDSQTIVPFSPMGFWRYVLKSLAARKAYQPKYIERLLQRDDVGSFELGELFDRIAQGGKLVVLLLDEFEHIVEHVNPDDPQFLYLLRALINRPLHGLALVLASRKPLPVLCQNMRFSGSPFPTSFTWLSLKPFSPEEANKLIDVYTQGTSVTFSDRDKEFAYEISKGHPYWLQKVCFKLFQRHHVEKVRMSGEQFSSLDVSDYKATKAEIRREHRESSKQKAKRRWPQISMRELATHRLSKALVTIGLVVSTVLLILALTLWYEYVYPEIVVGTQIIPDGIGYSVAYPEWIGVGDTERFRITLTNEGANPLSNVRVYLDFSGAATVTPPPGRSLTAAIGDLTVKNTWTDKIDFCPEKVNGTDIVQTDLLIASDELGEKLLNTYAFKVIDIPYLEDLRGPKSLIRWFLKGAGALAGAFLTALVVSLAKIVSS